MTLSTCLQCPCAEQKRKEAEIAQARLKDEELKKKKAKQDEVEKERVRRENLIEKRKQRFYQSLKKAEEKEAQLAKKAAASKLPDHTKLDSKRSSARTLDQISDLSSSKMMYQKQPDLIIMDGKLKTVTKEYIEEGGMIFETSKIDSLPDILEKEPTKITEAQEEEDIDEDDKTIQDDLKSLSSDDEDEVKEDKFTGPRMAAETIPFDKFLDMMEIF